MTQPAHFKSGTLGNALNLNLKVSLTLSFDGFHIGSSNDLQPFYLKGKKLFSLQRTEWVESTGFVLTNSAFVHYDCL